MCSERASEFRDGLFLCAAQRQVPCEGHDWSSRGAWSGLYREAQTYLDHAVAIDAENYGANFGLLQLYARTGDARREEQSKHFDQIKAKDEEHYQEMMRIISVRPEGLPES